MIYSKQTSSQPVPTPISSVYLWQIGFGFGYRYALAGLLPTSNASDPSQLVVILDDMNRHQSSLANFGPWRRKQP